MPLTKLQSIAIVGLEDGLNTFASMSIHSLKYELNKIISSNMNNESSKAQALKEVSEYLNDSASRWSNKQGGAFQKAIENWEAIKESIQ